MRRMFSSKWPKNPTFFSQQFETMKRQTSLNGMMNVGKLEDGLHALDFASTEYAEMKPFRANCLVQGMRDGNVYITERPKRVRKEPLFREDNSSLSLGRNGRYYFVFTLPEELVDELPLELVRQALSIAQKVEQMAKNGKEEPR